MEQIILGEDYSGYLARVAAMEPGAGVTLTSTSGFQNGVNRGSGGVIYVAPLSWTLVNSRKGVSGGKATLESTYRVPDGDHVVRVESTGTHHLFFKTVNNREVLTERQFDAEVRIQNLIAGTKVYDEILGLDEGEVIVYNGGFLDRGTITRVYALPNGQTRRFTYLSRFEKGGVSYDPDKFNGLPNGQYPPFTDNVWVPRAIVLSHL